MADVFLSYSSKDRTAAQRAVGALEKAGFSVFWDQQVPVGKDWNQWIGGKLAESRIAVVLWSKSSVQSRNVVHEATIAMERGKLIPAIVESLQAEEFPMGFYTVQAADLRTGEGVARLVAAVRERLGEDAAGADPIGAFVDDLIKDRAPRVAGLEIDPRVQAVLDKPRPPKARWPLPLLIGGVAAATALAVAGAMWVLPPGPKPVAEEAATPDPAAEAAAASPTERLLGDWRWDGIACGDGPRVTLDGADLVFTMTGVGAVRHVVDRVEGDTVYTVVLAPEAMRGDAYAIARTGDRLAVRTLADGTLDEWEACP